jgi:hypothetical protein
MHLVGYLYEAYHDARSLEHKVKCCIFPNMIHLNRLIYDSNVYISQ